MSSIASLLAEHQRLRAISDTPLLDAELLLLHCLAQHGQTVSRTLFRSRPESTVDEAVAQHFEALLARREHGEPVAYLTGSRGFWSLELEVCAATLIPRPATELLVEKTLELLADRAAARVLDLGTGTGAIALALASERPGWTLLGTDSHPDAVALAERNRERLQLSNAVFQQANWFDGIAPDARFHAIVSNPPYIAADDPHLQQGDVRFEPSSALVADEQGLAALHAISAGARDFLCDNGLLLMEHGYQQGEAVRDLLQRDGYCEVQTWADLAGQPRVSGGRWRE